MGGAVQCWGSNEFGQIGNGTTGGNLPPTLVPGLNATSVSAGSGYACAILSATGGVACWGQNGLGQFCDGNTTSSATPQVSRFGTSNYAPVSFVSAGLDHTCAVSPPVITCAGDNFTGDLGVFDPNMPEPDLDEVENLPANSTAVAVAAGGNEATCALLVGSGNTPMVSCWGKNSGGQLGDGNTADSPGMPVTAPLAHCP
jgi:alpha-tubulin suppressor-like RCC1 family protein